jgi:hypothetical protein
MNAENLEAQVIELAAQMGEVAPERVALTAFFMTSESTAMTL